MGDKPTFRQTCSYCQKVIEAGQPMKHVENHGWLHSWCADTAKSRKLRPSMKIEVSRSSIFIDLYDPNETWGFGGDEDW